MQNLVFKDVTPETWADFEALFEARGAPHFCYCMVWRAVGEERHMKGAARKACMKQRIDQGTPVGLLAYAEGKPVAWVSVGPRASHRRLGGLVVEGEPEDQVWSLSCFFITRAWRGKGLARQLALAAVEQARAKGAHVLEAYPVPPDAPSYRFMGLVPLFESLGFKDVGRAGHRRHVMRLALA